MPSARDYQNGVPEPAKHDAHAAMRLAVMKAAGIEPGADNSCVNPVPVKIQFPDGRTVETSYDNAIQRIMFNSAVLVPPATQPETIVG
jgi:hypothetical protein